MYIIIQYIATDCVCENIIMRNEYNNQNQE